MTSAQHTVREVQGADLQPGDRVWLDAARSIYDDGGYFAEVVTTTAGADPLNFVSWVDVEFANTDPLCDTPTRRYVIGTGSETTVLVLIEEA